MRVLWKNIRQTILMMMTAILAATAVYAAPLDFYASKTSSKDTDMVTMTTDLLFSQIQTIPGYTVQDKRNTEYSEAIASEINISFYAELQESETGGWVCTYYAAKGKKNFSLTKSYSSYYLILMDAKDSLESVLSNLEQDFSDLQGHSSSQTNASPVSADLESLSGNWAGDSAIDKIVILRGGRGFVIFKNGASMNITLSASGSKVTVTQLGKSNASFYPNLSREVAIKMAPTAEPTTWSFVLVDSNTLRGTETTLVADDTSSSGAKKGTVEVEWRRKN